MKYNNFIQELLKFDWQYDPIDNNIEINLETIANGKLLKTNENLLEFVKSFKTLANEEDNVWFLSIEDYAKKINEDGFAWNEFELDSMEYAEDDEQKASVTDFWNNHLPFMMSVKNGYAYVAIVLNGETKGSIVSGSEPEYEEPVTISSSLEEFFDKYILVLKNELDLSSLKILS
ncbi:hypothetical protein [Flavobacterium piscis]|uniref:SMI1/KNR4 family protein n=1 Tax=Flavobacterium piscis TaxID=1114874 RepID=A0ABU1YCB5_9FLAO|nr:hypothetical protein [Flavobacterium piscis]MDR7211798.1 hypothetical protein [Flavobacterium piscis]